MYGYNLYEYNVHDPLILSPFGWIFQPLNQGSYGPIYRKAFPSLLKVKMGLDLGFEPFNQVSSWIASTLTLTWKSSGLGPCINLGVTSSFDRVLI